MATTRTRAPHSAARSRRPTLSARSKCTLQPSTNYQVNLRYDDPSAASPGCAAGVQVCPLGTLQQTN